MIGREVLQIGEECLIELFIDIEAVLGRDIGIDYIQPLAEILICLDVLQQNRPG